MYCADNIFSLQMTVSAADVVDRLNLYDRFDRWRFLQNLLDDDVSADDANLVLFALCDSYLKNPLRPRASDSSPPELTKQRREIMETILRPSSARTLQKLLEASEESADVKDLDSSNGGIVLSQLEMLLPDPEEDEDAFKGLWDTVIELNGRESVKMNEREGRIQWKARCLITRVLLQYDFLTYGLVDEPL